MKYDDVCIESFGYTLPSEIWKSDDLEQRLEPLYSRLRLPAGRLELMTGIRERRFWPTCDRPSQFSVSSCNMAIEAAQFDRTQIGCLIHGSVCRDFLEPATACTVHHELGLPDTAVIYDVSNACLGILNGMLQAANMIELGQISAALVVGSEGGRQLVETTIDALNRDQSLTRKSIKSAIASLTIGSASCAVLLTHRSVSKSGNRLTAAAVTANTRYNDLCQSHQDQAGSDMAPLMETDSEALMAMGIETGVGTCVDFTKQQVGTFVTLTVRSPTRSEQRIESPCSRHLRSTPRLTFQLFPGLATRAQPHCRLPWRLPASKALSVPMIVLPCSESAPASTAL